jgi:hypothetical protein
MPVARPGDFITYDLYWQATEPLLEDYHAFLHLVNSKRKLLVQDDHLAGSALYPPTYWAFQNLQRDRYVLQVPPDTPNEVIWPIVGAYRVDTTEHLPVTAGQGVTLGDSYRLPAVKVLGDSVASEPQFRVDARLGEEIDLFGYDLEPPGSTIQPGESLTVTLYFQDRAPLAQDLTRFVHLYDPDLGMAAQVDSAPGNGSNPTWAWVPGETVLDRVVLTLPDHVLPGNYSLLVGFYDPVTGERLPARDRNGVSPSDRTLQLAELLVKR